MTETKNEALELAQELDVAADRKITKSTNEEILQYLKENTRYEDGHLYWTTSSTRRVIGRRVGTLNPNGYVHSEFLGRKHSLHRLIFLMHKGHMPAYVDHINGMKNDNRIENLRECSTFQNLANVPIRKTNRIGVKGVHAHATGGYEATVTCNKVRWSKLFQSLDMAVEAVNAKRAELHGEFARFA